MQRRHLIALAATSLVACSRRGSTKVYPSELPLDLGTSAGGYAVELTTDDIFDRGVTLDSLAEPGVYTVIGITTQHCALSQDIRRRMPSFLAARKDVVYKNVLNFSGSVTFSSKKEMNAWKSRRDAIQDKYHVDFGPKVVIYGPDLKPVVSDTAAKGRGYHFLHTWMGTACQGAC